ncbi:MAG TPA: hypothetical protein H9891_04790 [Candidatus Salinicoccus stercoripullorum]|uniref:ATP-grasp domain-containing protein n=1 Tax=Candidatus Salinicoccus stercoripullorum TaxID=2838756 RepID=A0A9D1QH66_9STAP|nr:hypothetical protein [Candidatus Salinicoccus stercoripullorum]
MKSSDLEYLFKNIPYTEKNIYPEDIVIENVAMYKDYMKDNGYHYEYEKLETGFMSANLLRHDKTKIARVKNPYYPTNSRLSFSIARNKFEAEKYLRAAGVPTTNSKKYALDQKEKAKKEAASFEGGIVIKPLNLALSQGVYSNVTIDTFDHYWNLCSNIIRKNKRKGKHILVQEYIEGFEARVTILEGKVVSVMTRLPGNVTGDGKSTIEELIDEKNEQKKQCGFMSKYPIKKTKVIEAFLEKSGYNYNSIPEKDEHVLLLSVSNLINGGEIVDVSDLVSEEIKETALDALAALPGMNCGGIDIMIKGFDDITPKIIEINAFPLLSVTRYPTYGNPSKAIEYFIDAAIVRDQYLNNIDNGYEIENKDEILSNYFNFFERKQRLAVNQFMENLK